LPESAVIVPASTPATFEIAFSGRGLQSFPLVLLHQSIYSSVEVQGERECVTAASIFRKAHSIY